jgi:hypothetical protein
MNDDLLTKVESLKLMLISRATGGIVNVTEYRRLRLESIALPRIAKLLPRFVHTSRDLDEFWAYIKSKFSGTGSYDQRREHIRDEFNPLLAVLEAESRSPSDVGITAAVRSVDSAYIQECWHKALERRANDPEGAITAARSLLETVCKHILDAESQTYGESPDLTKLHAHTAKQLNLSPSQHTEQVFKQILGGCHSVVEGLGALRNRHGDAHGKSTTAVKPAARHAELAVNLAGTMATFLLQTWEARKTASPKSA